MDISTLFCDDWEHRVVPILVGKFDIAKEYRSLCGDVDSVTKTVVTAWTDIVRKATSELNSWCPTWQPLGGKLMEVHL